MLEHPIKTNSVTTGVLCALGDVLAQIYEHRSLRRPVSPPPAPDVDGDTCRMAAVTAAQTNNHGGAEQGHTPLSGLLRRFSSASGEMPDDGPKPKYSALRTVRNLIFGLCVGGPLYSAWYRTLDVVSRSAMVSHAPPPYVLKRSTGHSHTCTDREQHPQHTHTHDKNNTPNPQTNTPHKHLTTLEGEYVRRIQNRTKEGFRIDSG